MRVPKNINSGFKKQGLAFKLNLETKIYKDFQLFGTLVITKKIMLEINTAASAAL